MSRPAMACVPDRPAGRVTVAGSLLACHGDQDIMRRLLEVEGRGRKWDEIGRHVLIRAGV